MVELQVPDVRTNLINNVKMLRQNYASKIDGLDIDLGRLEIVPMEEIDFDLDSRGREEYGSAMELKDFTENIITYGLISPIALYSESGNPPYELLAGGRRLLVCKEILQLTEIAARIYSTRRSERELKAIEYFENIQRKSLSWHEQDKMYKAYHSLRVESKSTYH